MKILVTGGTVFASRFTAEYFARENEVFVLNRGSRPQADGVTLIKADKHSLGDTLKGQRFDAVLDVCAYNASDIDDLLDALGEFGSYIMVSSSAVYPETLPQPFTESQQVGANSIWGAYGTDKITAEKRLIERVPDAYIIRPPYLYGKMNNLYREAFVFDCAERGLPFYIPKDGKMPLQFFDIEDLCKFIEVLFAKKPEQRVFNVGNPCVDINEWVRLCYGVLGKTPELVYVNQNLDQRSYFPFYDYGYELDTTSMSELMPSLKLLETGLAQSYEWYRDNKDQVRVKPLLEFIAENLA